MKSIIYYMMCFGITHAFLVANLKNAEDYNLYKTQKYQIKRAASVIEKPNIEEGNFREGKVLKYQGRPDCPDGTIDDCSGDGDCCPESWIGDGFSDCEDQAFGCDLTCYDNDGGDCDDSTTTTTTTTGGGNCVDNWIGDGYCDTSNNSEECQWDGGDCCGSTCINNTYDCGSDADWAACNSECLDPNANDDCCYDNSCPFTCAGNGLVDCWDGSCAEEESDCPIQTCLDTDCSNYLNNYTCPEIEEMYGYDCSICEAEGLCPITCEEEGLITCQNGECAYSEYDCNTCDNPDIANLGPNTSSGYDQYYHFTTNEPGFLTLSTAGSGLDTKFFVYASCDYVDIDNFPYGEYIAYSDDWGSSDFGECPDCTYWGESYIYVEIAAGGDYIIVSSDQYNYDNVPFEWNLTFNMAVEGCTNPFADNYNPDANIDDGSCEFSDDTFFVNCNGGNWQSETTWNLIQDSSGDIVLSGGSPYENLITLNPGDYYIHAFDSYGDGWNGDVWSLLDSDSNEVFAYTLEDGEEGLSRIFTIEASECAGDVNSDNIINISDVVMIINAIINNTTEELLDCGDMNEDGILNVSDLVIIIDLILN